MLLQLVDPALILLIGPSGSGKSTFARRNFLTTEILSSDFCRSLVCDDQNNQSATNDAFELLHLILMKRMRRRRTTVIDATNVLISSRELLTAIARENNLPSIAIVFALPEEACQSRNQQRADRQVPGYIIHQQLLTQLESLAHLQKEGFHSIFTLSTAAETGQSTVVREVHS